MAESTLEFFLVFHPGGSSAGRINKIGRGFAIAQRRINDEGLIDHRVSGRLVTFDELKVGELDFLTHPQIKTVSSEAILKFVQAADASGAMGPRREPASDGVQRGDFNKFLDSVTGMLNRSVGRLPSGTRRVLIIYSDLLNSNEHDFFNIAVKRIQAVDVPDVICLFVGYNARDERHGCAAGWWLQSHNLRSAAAVTEHALQVLKKFSGPHWLSEDSTDVAHRTTEGINVDLTCEECASITKSGVPGSLCSVCGRGRIVKIPRRQEEEDRRVEAEGLERDRQAAEARARSQAEEREASRRDAFSRRQAEARAQHEANERKRHVAVLASVRKQVANGYLEAAGKLFGSLGGRRFAGLEYGAVEKSLTKAQAALAEVEGMLEVALEALKAREAEVAKVTGLLIFPPVGRLRKHRIARLKAAEAMAAGVKYVEQLGGFSGEKIKRILGEARDIDQRIALSVLRLGRMVEVLGVLWAIVVTTGGLMFQQHLAVQERERQRLTSEEKAAEEKVLAEAKVEVTAEERESQRLVAEAMLKTEAAETVFASKLGLSKPFVAGDRGRAGDLAVRWIPSGRFTMGSPSSEPDRDSYEEQHEVVLTRGFFLAETECTQVQWVAIMESNKSIFGGSDRPVECVSWDDAVEYCRKLTVKQRGEGLLPVGWEWRLPTESEWEYAARGGETGPRHGQLDTIGWYDGNSGSQTHPVKQKAANAWGLHDMLGNVSEWCSDWHVSYPSGSVMDPTGTGSGSLRVFRGGGWYYDDRDARSAFRGRDVPGLRHFSLGFRPALSSVR